MKKIYSCILLLILSSLFLFFVNSCKKEESNESPTCKIISPTDKKEVTQETTVTISAEADDIDGSIYEVCFFIDAGGKGSANSFPYNYSWNTSDENLGSHSVKVTAYDNDGATKSIEISVTIVKANSAEITLLAAFTVNSKSINAGQLVQFNDQSTNTPTNWSWDFWDGGTSTQQNPSYTYNSAGTYTVSLTATNTSGSDAETKTNYITVNSTGVAPVAAFTANATTINAGEAIQFTDLNSKEKLF
jgi:PKD repeat protein